MCGIVGQLSRGTELTTEAVVRGRDLLAHRGPEGFGVWTSGLANNRARITLGHRRLCIIDLAERSAQPMLLTKAGNIRPSVDDSEQEARLALVYNGEIYNYIELRTELRSLGHRFATTGDAEVLLMAYLEWGHGCLERLNGMFSFALWDAHTEELFCARDRFGEKPFHYVCDPARGLFAFGSEIKALVGMGAASADLDRRALYRYFRYGEQAGSDQTIWSGVKRLPRAHGAVVTFRADAPHMRMWQYWTLPPRKESGSAQESIAEFAHLFEDSVRIRLRSDVPVGSSLSGGLDSSSVVCQVSRMGAAAGQLAFTARMPDPALDESHFAALVAHQAGVTSHMVMPTADELIAEFDRLFYHQEEPFPTTSIFASYLVQRLAREHGITVLLDGQGADEYLAGYAHYPATLLLDLARKGRVNDWWRERRLLRQRRGVDPLPPRAAMWQWWHARSNGQGHLNISEPADVHFLRADFREEFGKEQPRSMVVADGLLDARLRADLLEGHLQELLRYADRNAMAFARETRLPFLDQRLVELVMTRKLDLTYRDGESKWILRRAMRGVVPDEILDRTDKVGFVTPWKQWIAGPIADALTERLRDSEKILTDFVAPESLNLQSPHAISVMAVASVRNQLANLPTAVSSAR